jgi:hypothetical protein
MAMHLVHREGWATIDLDVTNGHVFVRQDWFYEWRDPPRGVAPWTADEKAAFHHAVDHLIWGHWSMRASITVSRSHTRASATGMARDPVARFPHRRLTLSFDVRKVPTRTQWLIQVGKVDPKLEPKDWPRPMTWFEQRRMELYDSSITKRHAKPPPEDLLPNDHRPKLKKRPTFYQAPHEFGHAIGYGHSHEANIPDDYERKSSYNSDVQSIMNVGRRLRARHLFMIMGRLGRMVPGCTFTAGAEP